VTPLPVQPWRANRSGVRLIVRVTPRAGRDEVHGLTETGQGQALAVRVRAAADKGEANRAVEMVVASWLGIAKSGAKSRVKTLVIAGEPDRLGTLLKARLGELQ
jgi:uncharacterized protein YggU (UPF0235/DUF167 family)